jgi:hypothetical protein
MANWNDTHPVRDKSASIFQKVLRCRYDAELDAEHDAELDAERDAAP